MPTIFLSYALLIFSLFSLTEIGDGDDRAGSCLGVLLRLFACVALTKILNNINLTSHLGEIMRWCTNEFI